MSYLKVFSTLLPEYICSIKRIFSIPTYALLKLSSLFRTWGIAVSMSFLPKYVSQQYRLPLWKANIIMAFCSIMVGALGSFLGGVITRCVQMTPLRLSKLLILFFAVQTTAQISGFFLGCDQPELFGDNIQRTQSPHYKLTESACSTNCDCDEGRYFPICGDDGRSYFSPCHAGCTEKTLREFTNCTCIETGHATAGLCDDECSTKLYIYAAVMSIGKLFTALKAMPSFIGKMRCVEERDRAVGQACEGFLNSCLGFMPAPVIFGAFVDSTCSLWKYTCGERQSCALYDINDFRILLHTFLLTVNGMATLTVVILYVHFKVSGKTQWEGEEKRLKALQSRKELEIKAESNEQTAIEGETTTT